MHISEKLKKYISNSKNVCHSNILITDLKGIKLNECLDKSSSSIVTSDNLNIDILKLISCWNSNNVSKSELICIMNQDCFKIFKDDINTYSAQMIFPLHQNNTLLGLMIFYRTNNNYIISSIKSVYSLVNFTNKIINEEN